MIVTLDVGASKVRAGLFSHDKYASDAKFGRYLTSDWSGLIPLLKAFVAEHGSPMIDVIVVGVAGPVVGSTAKMTNLAWTFDADEIGNAFTGASVALVNDLVAHGYGTLELDKADMLELKTGQPRLGNRALIAAGSGLGECILFWNGTEHVPTASEGGHTDFAPSTEEQIELLRFVQKKHQGHVSWERIISGNLGFENLYQFYRAQGLPAVAAMDEAISQGLPLGPALHESAERGERTALAIIELFFDLYAAEAGNLALKTFAVGGVYVSGGIARKLQKWLKPEKFAKLFASKGRMSELLVDVPVYLVTDPNAAVKGLAVFARRSLARPVLSSAKVHPARVKHLTS